MRLLAGFALLVGFALLALLAGLVEFEDKKEKLKDEEAILGAWQVVKIESEGKDVTPPAHALEKLRFVFETKNAMAYVDSLGEEHKGVTYTIDPAAKVKTIDIYKSGPKALGVYELDGDTLKISLPVIDKPRPTDMRALDHGTGLMTLKRVKDEKYGN
jgi:uncharacterized protein (TIGR03067 family)